MSKKRQRNKPHKPAARIALADLGSNKFHFRVCEKDESGNHIVLDRLDATPALGQGMSNTPPFFNPGHLAEALKVLQMGAGMFAKHGIAPDMARCVATAAFREAQKRLTVLIKQGHAPTIEKAGIEINAMRQVFKPYCFEIISGREEAEKVALAAFHDLYEKPTPQMQKLVEKSKLITVAHCGGLSTELDNLRLGKTIRKSVLNYGAHTQSNIGKSGPQSASSVLAKELKRKWPEKEHPLLAVSGGVWRAVGKLVSDRSSSALSAKEATKRLENLARKSPDQIERLGEKKRAPYIAAASQALLQIIEHTGAQNVVFLTSKMVSVLDADLPRRRNKRQKRHINGREAILR